MRKLPSRKLLATIVAGALFLPSSGFTLGLGEIEVNSALNQKLRADIELLSATPEDAENIIVKLASRKEFSRAGLDRPYSLSDLRFKSEVIDGVPYIKVSTGSPVREPFLNFLIEIDWPNGHLLREYTVLLDPPVFMTKSAVDTAESRPASPAASESRPASSGSTVSGATGSAVNVPVPMTPANASSSPVESSQTAPARTFTPAPVVQQQTPVNQQTANQPPGSYRIKSGDTSWSLADAMRPNQNITVPQMMFAMLRANPESFINENINGLKRGYILRVPDAEQIAAISQADAQAMMREHWALWRQHVQAKSGGQPVSAMQSDGSTNGSGTGGEASQAADNAHLSIVSAGSGTSIAGTKDPSDMTAQELRAELAAARERVETERVEKEALQSRINALEQNVGEREGLLTIEDEGLSGVQSLNTDSDTVSSEPEVGSTDSETEGEVVSDADAGESQDIQSDAVNDSAVDDAAVTDESGMTAEKEGDATADAVFTDEVTGSAIEEPVAEDGQVSGEMPEQAAATDVTASQPAGDESVAVNPLAQLLDDPKLLAAAGGGLLLIVALIALMIKRRKSGEDDEPEVANTIVDLESLADEIAEENAVEDTVVDSAAVIPEVDNDDVAGEEDITEVTGTEEEEKAVVTDDGATRDDVIAEADVYLAYGIYQQAEDLLNQAITENPDRNDYRFKLAETHYASKNATAFAEVASELKGRIEDEDSADWDKLLVMGQDICADDPMFKTADAAELDLDTSVADGPIMELDDDSNEGDSLANSDLDLTMDDALDLPEMDVEKNETDQLDEIEGANSVEPVEEIEFDIADTDAIEESDSVEDEFDLDIDVAELDIENQNASDSMEEIESENTVIDATETAEIEEESMDLGDIDLGLDEDDTVAETSTDEVHELEDVELQDTEMKDADLQGTELDDTDIDFGLDDSVSEAEDNMEVEEEIELDLSEEIAPESSEDESVAEITAGDAVAIDSEQSEDPSDVTLDTLPDEPAEAAQTIPAANDDLADSAGEEDFDLSSLDDVDEISTKLDLARAYLDMGDAEGTRGILEEVLVDGNDEQKQEANDLLDKLA